jgi:hypothetical protein
MSKETPKDDPRHKTDQGSHTQTDDDRESARASSEFGIEIADLQFKPPDWRELTR